MTLVCRKSDTPDLNVHVWFVASSNVAFVTPFSSSSLTSSKLEVSWKSMPVHGQFWGTWKGLQWSKALHFHKIQEYNNTRQFSKYNDTNHKTQVYKNTGQFSTTTRYIWLLFDHWCKLRSTRQIRWQIIITWMTTAAKVLECLDFDCL